MDTFNLTIISHEVVEKLGLFLQIFTEYPFYFEILKGWQIKLLKINDNNDKKVLI